MIVAVTGGAGLVGRRLARALSSSDHAVVLITRDFDRRDLAVRELEARSYPIGTDYEGALVQAFAGCDGVAPYAGINREIGSENFRRVHVEGAGNGGNAAKRARVKKTILLSFRRARPSCGSGYHEPRGRRKNSSEPRASIIPCSKLACSMEGATRATTCSMTRVTPCTRFPSLLGWD
jgi:nucleoside-diphosphate-sugar epimerase